MRSGEITGRRVTKISEKGHKRERTAGREKKEVCRFFVHHQHGRSETAIRRRPQHHRSRRGRPAVYSGSSLFHVGLDYFLISPNISSDPRHVGRLPRQFRREKGRRSAWRIINAILIPSPARYLTCEFAKETWCTRRSGIKNFIRTYVSFEGSAFLCCWQDYEATVLFVLKCVSSDLIWESGTRFSLSSCAILHFMKIHRPEREKEKKEHPYI